MMALLVSIGAIGLVVSSAWWLLRAGEAGGDRPADAHTRLLAGSGGVTPLVVTNPGPQVVVVGVTVRRHRAGRLDSLRSHLVVRPARWYERRRHDRGAVIVLGAVGPDREGRWELPLPAGPVRVVVLVGQGAGRLRVHEHLAGTDHHAGLTFVSPSPLRPPGH